MSPRETSNSSFGLPKFQTNQDDAFLSSTTQTGYHNDSDPSVNAGDTVIVAPNGSSWPVEDVLLFLWSPFTRTYSHVLIRAVPDFFTRYIRCVCNHACGFFAALIKPQVDRLSDLFEILSHIRVKGATAIYIYRASGTWQQLHAACGLVFPKPAGRLSVSAAVNQRTCVALPEN